jgi:hypothetical protein
MPSTKSAAFVLVIVALGLIIGFPVRSFSQDSDTLKHPLVSAARKDPMMTMGPSGQDPAYGASTKRSLGIVAAKSPTRSPNSSPSSGRDPAR